jgi:DNA-binding NarL/FixJ family response regulator
VVALQVLIVDDHASFRRIARLMLVAAGFDVIGEAADAESARQQIERLRPDAVLLDVMLPDGSGVQVARDLADEPGSPRVVLTSSRTRSDFGLSFDWPGGCNFIPKHELSGAALAQLLTGA